MPCGVHRRCGAGFSCQKRPTHRSKVNLTSTEQLVYNAGMIKVQDKTGNKHELEGRLERLVEFVLQNAAEIARPQNAQIVFDCAGGAVSASIRKQLEVPRPEA
jgi:hypothetical protein